MENAQKWRINSRRPALYRVLSSVCIKLNRYKHVGLRAHVNIASCIVSYRISKLNKSMFSFFISAVNMTLPALAAERRAAAPLLQRRCCPPLLIDTVCPHGAQQQTRRTPLLRLEDGTNRQTDTVRRPCRRLCEQCQ